MTRLIAYMICKKSLRTDSIGFEKIIKFIRLAGIHFKIRGWVISLHIRLNML